MPLQSLDGRCQAPDAQREAVGKIQSFIDNINAGALGTLGTLFLVFVAVRLLMAIVLIIKPTGLFGEKA